MGLATDEVTGLCIVQYRGLAQAPWRFFDEKYFVYGSAGLIQQHPKRTDREKTGQAR
jgi:nitrogen regulatory protein PII-like uncharacterized protein